MVFYDAEVAMILAVSFAVDAAQKHDKRRVHAGSWLGPGDTHAAFPLQPVCIENRLEDTVSEVVQI